jgi:glycosyltransferase involved in cell wall biosynthesis
VKVLHVIGSVDPKKGGTTGHVFSSCQIWSRRGHECHILCLDPPDATWVAESSVTTFALGGRGGGHQLARKMIPWLRYGYTPALVRWLQKHAHRYDAVVLNGLWNFTSYGSWMALRNSNVPYFVCPHGMLDPWLRQAHPTSHFLRIIVWNLFEWKVLRDARGIFFASEEERKLAHQSFLRWSPREHVVGYGTQEIFGDANTQKAAFLSMFPQMRGRKLILFLSRIHQKKGLDLLIQAFARHAAERMEFDLLIAGPDEDGLAPQLAGIAAALGIDKRIHWVGMLTGDEKWGAFRSAEFFVLPSHQENFGIAVVEAMALAVPVLITRKVNIWREVESSGGGHVVLDEEDQIAEGLHYMCTLSQPQLQIMGGKARSCFLERFNLENNAMELLHLMTSLSKDSATKESGGPRT